MRAENNYYCLWKGFKSSKKIQRRLVSSIKDSEFVLKIQYYIEYHGFPESNLFLAIGYFTNKIFWLNGFKY